MSAAKRRLTNAVIVAGSIALAIGLLALTKWNSSFAFAHQFQIEHSQTYPGFDLQPTDLVPYVLTYLLYLATAFFGTRHVLRFRLAMPLKGVRLYACTTLFTASLSVLTLYPFIGLYAGFLVILTATTGYLVIAKKLFKNA